MKKLLVYFLPLLVAACTVSPPRKPVDNPQLHWQQREQQLQKLDNWSLNGRISIINGEESWHLSIDWQQQQDQFALNLSGPFGQGAARLTGNTQGVMLTDAENNTFFSHSPDQLLYERTGVRMPVDGLRYWIRGLPDPRYTETSQIDEFGRLDKLSQHDWQVRFRNYIQVNAQELPDKIFIDGHDLKVRLVIDEWNLSAVEQNP